MGEVILNQKTKLPAVLFTANTRERGAGLFFLYLGLCLHLTKLKKKKNTSCKIQEALDFFLVVENPDQAPFFLPR